MRRLASCVLVVATSCATSLPLTHLFSDEETSNRSTFDRCAIGYYLAGLAIDGVVVAGDVVGGKEWNGYDALLVVPLGIDAILATSMIVDCVRED